MPHFDRLQVCYRTLMKLTLSAPVIRFKMSPRITSQNNYSGVLKQSVYRIFNNTYVYIMCILGKYDVYGRR